MFSDDSSSRGGNSDDEETEVYVQKLADGIRDGSMVMKNGDGTYKCPLSPGRKKQSYTYCGLQTHATQYKYRELLGLADATQIGSGKKGHGALEKFLDSKPMVAHLEQAVPSRGAGATRLLAPWMGILVNIDNTRTNEQGRRLAAGGADIKEKFQEYNPEKVEVFPDFPGHHDTAVLTFRNDIHGLEDAQAFAHSFATANRGSKEWRDEARAYSLDLYGWQATEEDLTVNLGQMTAYLKKFCNLKSVRDMVEEKERMNKQVVEDLVKKVDQKNDTMAASRHQFVVLRNMVHEVNSLRVKAEEEKRTMEEQLKRDLEAMQLQVQANEAELNKRLLAYQTTLAEKFRTLEGQRADLEARQLQVQAKEAAHNERVLAHQTEKLRALEGRCADLEAMHLQVQAKEAAHNERVLAHQTEKFRALEGWCADLEAMHLQVQAKEAAHNERVLAHQTAPTEKLRALEGRCEAMKKAEVQMRQENEAERQRFEREKQDAERLLEEAREQAELHAATQCKQLDEQKRIIKKHEDESEVLKRAVLDQNMKLYERLERELQKKHGMEMLEIEKLNEMDKEKIEELESEQESLQEMVNALSQKERKANHLLEDARKVAVQVLHRYGVKERIDNKLVGSIDKKPWAAACQKKFMYHPDGWELVMTKMISEWEDRIGDQGYYPFELVKVDPEGNEWKRIINENDEFIKKLKEDLGVEVMQTVATAFFEIEEYNASGRYPMFVAWNFETNERLQLKDLLLFLKGLVDAAMRKQIISTRKRARTNE